MRVQSFLDLTQNELRNALLQNLASDPTGLVAGNAGLHWFNTGTKLAKVWNGTGYDTITNLVESVNSTTPALSASLSTKQIQLSIANATGGQAGLLAAADYTKLAGSTNSNTASTLVQRDASGNFSAGTITAALNGLASNSSALGGQTLAQVRDFSQTTGQRNATSAISDFDTQVRTSRLDQMAGPTGPTSFNSQRITNVADPTGPQDAATKNYVDSVATGLDAKASVTYATTAALPANTYANGTSGVGATLTANANGALSVDGQAVSASQRILVKNEATAANNGIYVVTQAGSGAAPYILTRTTDADQAAEVTGGMFTFVEGGSTMAASGWVLSLVGPATIGTTGLTFAQFSGGAAYTAGNGISIVGNVVSVRPTTNRISVSSGTVDIDAAYVGQSSITTLGTIGTGVWQGTAVGVAYGGTGATTATGARANLAATGKNSVNIPAGTTYTFNHGLNTTDVHVMCTDLSTGDVVFADFKVVDANNVSVTFGAAVAANAYRLIVVG